MCPDRNLIHYLLISEHLVVLFFSLQIALIFAYFFMNSLNDLIIVSGAETAQSVIKGYLFP